MNVVIHLLWNEEDMMPKFCPFCSNPVYNRDVDEKDEYNDDNFPFGD